MGVPPIRWLQDGEKANEENLNRPLLDHVEAGLAHHLHLKDVLTAHEEEENPHNVLERSWAAITAHNNSTNVNVHPHLLEKAIELLTEHALSLDHPALLERLTGLVETVRQVHAADDNVHAHLIYTYGAPIISEEEPQVEKRDGLMWLKVTDGSYTLFVWFNRAWRFSAFVPTFRRGGIPNYRWDYHFPIHLLDPEYWWGTMISDLSSRPLGRQGLIETDPVTGLWRYAGK
ncbi:MAG: hypothetical protein GXO39_09290 [Thermotogae bacterium]|nr:hypothetical protein [Thermotogota bacterium]